jgi:DNA-binding response OmpR family regulator
MDGETGVEMALTGIYTSPFLDRMLPKLDGIWLHNLKKNQVLWLNW